MEESKILSTVEEVKAISDPFKYRILMYYKKIEKPATVKQVADALGEVPAKVYYHVKKMESLEILKLQHTEEIRGIIAKFYEPSAMNYEIKYSEGETEVNKKLILTEGAKLISELYETSKNIFLGQMEKDVLKKEDARGTVSLFDLAMTHEEAIALGNYIKGFAGNHEIKENRKENEPIYHMMVTLIELREESK